MSDARETRRGAPGTRRVSGGRRARKTQFSFPSGDVSGHYLRTHVGQFSQRSLGLAAYLTETLLISLDNAFLVAVQVAMVVSFPTFRPLEVLRWLLIKSPRHGCIDPR